LRPVSPTLQSSRVCDPRSISRSVLMPQIVLRSSH
jgi:hypothetical protein